MLRPRIPDILLGAILGGAIVAMGSFATGFVLGSLQQTSQFTQDQGSQDRSDETGNGKQNETLRHWLTRDAGGFFTLWLVIVGGCQLVLFWVQLRLIRKSLIDAKTAADAARDGAKAAQRSADIAKRAFTELERPYLYVMCGDGLSYNSTTGRVVAFYRVINHGKSAAIVEEVIVSLAPAVAFPSETVGAHVAIDNTLVARRIIGPGEERDKIEASPPGNITFDVPDSEPVLNTSRDEEVFLWVRISYRGPFTRDHETRDMWRIDPLSNRFVESHGLDERYNCIK
jgi:hypothetical protein